MAFLARMPLATSGIRADRGVSRQPDEPGSRRSASRRVCPHWGVQPGSDHGVHRRLRMACGREDRRDGVAAEAQGPGRARRPRRPSADRSQPFRADPGRSRSLPERPGEGAAEQDVLITSSSASPRVTCMPATHWKDRWATRSGHPRRQPAASCRRSRQRARGPLIQRAAHEAQPDRPHRARQTLAARHRPHRSMSRRAGPAGPPAGRAAGRHAAGQPASRWPRGPPGRGQVDGAALGHGGGCSLG